MEENRLSVMIIGSTRFKKEMEETAWELSRKGWVVWLPLFRPEDADDIDESLLEDIGLAKIDMVDTVLVFNKDHYIGSSTQKEIEYCKFIKKPMRYLED